MSQKLKIAIPSKGSLGQTSIDFLKDCGIKVQRKSDRQYTGNVKNFEIEVMFQRAEDIPQKVRDKTTHLGITGRDIVEEYRTKNDPVQVFIPKLKYGKANLVIAIPESWIHVSSIYDLAELAAKWSFGENPKNIRIATKFNHLTEGFLHKNNIYNYSLINASGVLEITPKLNVADIIVDLTSTGTTMRENQLKAIEGGTILKSEACLIGNVTVFDSKFSELHPILEEFVDRIESHLRAKGFLSVSSLVYSNDPGHFEKDFLRNLNEVDVQPESFYASSPVHESSEKSKVFVNMILNQDDLYKVVRCLRKYEIDNIITQQSDYLFYGQSSYYEESKNLYESLKSTLC